MIDVHSHVLPGLDDGARDLNEACAILEAARDDGVRKIVATPHVIAGGYENTSADITSTVERLRLEIADRGIDIDIVPGAELYMTPDLEEQLRLDPGLAIGGGRYVLLELPPQRIPPFAGNMICSLVGNGYVPIIAHPERNMAIARDVDTVIPFIHNGVFLQVNAGSILGYYGRTAAKTAKTLLERDLGYLIGSDIHTAAGDTPKLSKAIELASQWIGKDRALSLVTSNPALIFL